MEAEGNGRRWVLVGVTVLCLAGLALLLFHPGRNAVVGYRIRRYFGVGAFPVLEVVSERDGYSWAFMDGEYVAVIRTTRGGVRRLLESPPPWAGEDWRSGRRTNLEATLCMPNDAALASVAGREGRDVYRIITIDMQTGTVYFELKEY